MTNYDRKIQALANNLKERSTNRKTDRKTRKKNLNNFIDSHTKGTPFNPDFLLNVEDDVFENHTSEEDNEKEPELYEGSPWDYVAPQTPQQKFAEKLDIDDLFGVLNRHEKEFKTSIGRSYIQSTPNPPQPPNNSSSTTSSNNSGKNEKTKEISKKRKLNNTQSSESTLSAFDAKSLPDELTRYINSNPNVLLNFGTNQTFECNKSYKKHELLIKRFINYSHKHLIEMLPEEIKLPPDSQGFFSFTPFKDDGEEQPDFNGSVMTKSTQEEGEIADEINDFCILTEHSYLKTNQFNLLHYTLAPVLNRIDDKRLNGLESSIQTHKVIRIDTVLMDKKESLEKDFKRIVWENVVYWLCNEEDLNGFEYDMFLIMFMKNTIYGTNNYEKQNYSTTSEKVLKAYMFLRCPITL